MTQSLKHVLTKTVSAVFMCMALVMMASTVAHASSDITIDSAKVTSSNTVLVTLDDTGEDLDEVSVSKWHIDQNGGGSNPLTPTSAKVTSEDDPWTVTLIFSGTPFKDTATSYTEAKGLYVDAEAVTDEDGDTNEVTEDDDSIEVEDGQAPTFSVVRTNATTLTVTFSESVDASDTAVAAWTVEGGTVTAVTDPANSTTLVITVSGLVDNTSIPAVGYVASKGTVADASSNEVATSVVIGTVVCQIGHVFDPISGKKCTSHTVPGSNNGSNGNGNGNTSGKGNGNHYALGKILVKHGSKGGACLAWQTFLNAHGAHISADGACGKMTMAAARVWQASVGLTADGVLGAKSREKAEAEIQD